MNTFLPKGGGYRNLVVFRITEIVCDLSVFFAGKFIKGYSRTRDQMEQAARSGKQNIVEGSEASVTSKEMEIKLTNVAKASLEELLNDYEDYLRQHNLTKWDRTHPRFEPLRKYLISKEFMNNPMRYADVLSDEEFCNMCLTLINQATYMLRKLLEAQQKQFLATGGIRELMYNARIEARNKQDRKP